MSGFGFKTHWIAVRDRSTLEVADALRLVDRAGLPWDEGTDLAYADGVYVAPPVSGWTLAHGRTMVPEYTANWAPLVAWVADLSEQLGEVQCFGNERGGASYQWIRAEHGQVSRAYGVNDGDLPLFLGEPTAVELRLGVGTRDYAPDWRQWGDDEWLAWHRTVPNEMQVLKVAEDWSVDPYRIDQAAAPGLGLHGRPGKD